MKLLRLVSLVGMATMSPGMDSTISVCAALLQRLDLNGKVVAIRGEVEGGHGAFLVDSACDVRLTSKGAVWGNLIEVAYPERTMVVPFEVDWASVRKADAIARRAGFQPGKHRLVGTYVGLFQTHTDLENHVYTEGIVPRFKGFGDSGVAPARLILKEVTDIQVIRKSLHRKSSGKMVPERPRVHRPFVLFKKIASQGEN